MCGSASSTSRVFVPAWWCFPGSGLDSARAIVRRDLDYSDRFEMIALADAPTGPSTGRGGAEGGPVNYGIYKALGRRVRGRAVARRRAG